MKNNKKINIVFVDWISDRLIEHRHYKGHIIAAILGITLHVAATAIFFGWLDQWITKEAVIIEVNESFGTNVYTVEVQNMFKTKLYFYERDVEFELGDKVLVTYLTRPIQYWVKDVDDVQLIE